MKHNTLKKTLSLLLVICMMASFAGCIPGEEDPTEPSTIETTGSTENTTVPIVKWVVGYGDTADIFA